MIAQWGVEAWLLDEARCEESNMRGLSHASYLAPHQGPPFPEAEEILVWYALGRARVPGRL
eukprot:3747558-Pyramimonas_sp.AAC.1